MISHRHISARTFRMQLTRASYNHLFLKSGLVCSILSQTLFHFLHQLSSNKMQGNRGGGNPFFGGGDPFAGFGGFGDRSSMISSFFGGRDPFDDPFFTQPFGGGMMQPGFGGMMQPSFGGMMQPNFGGMMQPNFGGMMQSNFFGGQPFQNMHPSGFLEHQPPEPKRSNGPIIEELSSDDEKGTNEEGRTEKPRKHSRSSNPTVEDLDEKVEEKKSKHLHELYARSRPNDSLVQPQSGSFSFQSSSVTYGGANGAYYTSSTTRRTGSDGVTFEERKEADTAARKATHRISRGIHNKGHSLTRKLSSDGNVETMQTLHNLNEDELPGFEAAWKGKRLPGRIDAKNKGKHFPQQRTLQG